MKSSQVPYDLLEEGIAVIGMAGQFPQAENTNVFWEHLLAGHELVTHFTDRELEAAGVPPSHLHHANYVKSRGVLSTVEAFDASVFHISPYEASLIDPQQRLFVEKCWEALEVAGYRRTSLVTGVFGSIADNTYLYQQVLKNAAYQSIQHEYHTAVFSSPHFLATRVSYLLNLQGPSMTISTACSSSLVAVIQACRALLSRECDIALAGGVSIKFPHRQGYFYKKGGIFSSDGHCRPFDHRASGTVSGAGVGVVVLKRLRDAIQSNDTIDAVIRDFCINNDGSAKAGYTAPSVLQQAQCISRALLRTDPRTIGYVEAHGTGTTLGDPIEFEALTRAYRQYTSARQYCALGSVKANIGHADTAAGIVGLIKAILVLKHRTFPPLVHFEAPNALCAFTESPFYVNRECQTWESVDYPHRAAVNSLGIGGTNAHVILEAYQMQPSAPSLRSSQILLYSGHTPDVLVAHREQLHRYITQYQTRQRDAAWMADAAFSLAVGRQHFAHREAVWIPGDHLLTVSTPVQTILDLQKKRKVVFLFPGQTTLTAGCLQVLYEEEPDFRALCEAHYARIGDVAVRQRLWNVLMDPRTAEGEREALLQPALFIRAFLIAQLFVKWGIVPDAIMGHSLGEYGAACMAGMIDFETTVSILMVRQALCDHLPPGGMWAVALPEAIVRPLATVSGMAIAAVNSPQQTVVSGTEEAWTLFASRLRVQLGKSEAQHIPVIRLPVQRAFHSPAMEPICAAWARTVARISFSDPHIAYVSSVTGEGYVPDAMDPCLHFTAQLHQPVLFSAGIQKLLARGSDFFIEMNVQEDLTQCLKQHVVSHDVLRSSLRSRILPVGGSEAASLVLGIRAVLGLAWVNGVPFNPEAYYQQEKRRRVPLPTYAFSRQTYIIEPDPVANMTVVEPDFTWYEPYWVLSPLKSNTVSAPSSLCTGRCIIFSDGSLFSETFVKTLQARQQKVVVVEQGDIFASRGADHYSIRIDKVEDYQTLADRLQKTVSVPGCIIYAWSLSDSERLQDVVALQWIARYILRILSPQEAKCFILVTHSNQLEPQERIDPWKAMLTGLSIVMGQEYQRVVRLIDVSRESATRMAEGWLGLLEEIGVNTSDPLVVYRGLYRFVRAYRPFTASLSLPPQADFLRSGGTYLVTGAGGRMGGVIAEHLARVYQAHLVLWAHHGSTILDAQCESLKKWASSVQIYIGDMGQSEQGLMLQRGLIESHTRIEGIFHCAGNTEKIWIDDFDATQLDHLLSAKVLGTQQLFALVEAYHPRFCVLASSLSTVLGGLGLGVYAAANAFLDAWALLHRNESTAWISIRWDALSWDPDSAEAFWDALVLLLQQPVSSLENVIVSRPFFLKRLQQAYAHLSPQEGLEFPARDSKKAIACAEVEITSDMDVKQKLLSIFGSTLGMPDLREEDDFYASGGNSLLAIQILSRIESELGWSLHLSDLIHTKTVCALAEFLMRQHCLADASAPKKILLLNHTPASSSLFLIHPAGGAVFCYLEWAAALDRVVSCYAIEDPALQGIDISYPSLSTMAAQYKIWIQQCQPHGPYQLGGYSLGGVIAFEIARQLIEAGEQVSFVMMIDSWATSSSEMKDFSRFVAARERLKDTVDRIVPKHMTSHRLLLKTQWQRMQLLFEYNLPTVEVTVFLVKAGIILPEYHAVDDPTNHWKKHVHGTLLVETVSDAHHEDILPHKGLSAILQLMQPYILRPEEV